MSKKYIIALDQGTTSSRSVLFDETGKICSISQQETEQIYPEHGWVEQNPLEIYQTQIQTLQNVVKEENIKFSSIVAIG
ncbi:MAG: glycerol kinase, partial [Flavobacteriaceae bacterium]|nr:glycerol kinase [Flavobacteriaceae bacterium]